MMKKPFFSVIIPLYNKENFIEPTIESVLNQNFQDFEILIVEDCSTDSSKDIASLFASEKLKIIQHEHNKGLSASRNTGIRNATAEYVVFLDADDLMQVTYLNKIFELIKNFPDASLFATNYEEVFKKNRPIKTSINIDDSSKDQIITDFFQANLKQPLYCQSSLCVKKNAFDTIGFYDETITYSEDVDFNIRANYHLLLAYSSAILVIVTKYDSNQITNNSMFGKKIPDFNAYENLAIENKNLKKYLDINRYMLASNYKKENDLINFQKLKNRISRDPQISGLNFKQRLLLQLPVFAIQLISKIKQVFLKKGVSFSSFSK